MNTCLEAAQSKLDVVSDLSELEAAYKELETVLHAAGQEVYAKNNQSDEAEVPPQDGDIIDVEYDDVN